MRFAPLVFILKSFCIVFTMSMLLPFYVAGQNTELDSIQRAISQRNLSKSINKSNNPSLQDTNSVFTAIKFNQAQKAPVISVQQALKGQVAGLYVREENGEPGSEQFMYLRGMSTPLFSKQDLYAVQPIVYINGIPMTQDNGFTYGIQRYDFNKIGSATNPLATIDVRNIEKIEILKSPADIATLGPLANNGAIWITTKNANPGVAQINVESYFGMLQKPSIYEINGNYENTFRNRYYDAYATEIQRQNAPIYMKNTNDVNYFGSSNWSDIYYKSRPVFYVGAGIKGGSARASFLFNASVTKDQNFDNTKLDKYNILFGINMIPVKWLTISSSINATRIERERNRNLSDRFAETRFVPDLSNPLPPNKDAYQQFLDKYRGSVDNNQNTGVQSYLKLTASFNKLQLNSLLSIDYQESVRDVFWGKELMDNNNFASYYAGFNQRLSARNTATYYFDLGTKSRISLEAGNIFTSDIYKYDYVLAYNTPNDFIKIKQILQNSSGIYYYPDNIKIFAYPFTNKLRNTLSSVFGQIGYNYKKIIELNAVAKYDGYSNYNKYNRWLLTPVVSAKINVHEFDQPRSVFSTFSIKGSWGIFGKLVQDDRYRLGTQYRVDLGYPDEPFLGSYAGLVGLSKPYNSGLLFNNYNWPFTEKLNVGMDLGTFEDRVLLSADFYYNHDKNLIVPINMPTEKGFSYKYVQGMSVLNSGVDLKGTVNVIKREHLNWSLFGNFNYNKNKLTKLPYGLREAAYADKKIEVGKPVDSYWLYENNGIIKTAGDIPNGAMSFSGTIAFAPGDPLWKDTNGDGGIDTRDKVVKGNSLPKYTGGFGSELSYKGISLGFNFYYALSYQLLNQSTASKLDFINADLSKSITDIKEITFWQKTFDYNNYPLYNPWSSVVPYRVDQDLFLEDASFLKLRYLTLGYDLVHPGSKFKKGFSKFLIYATATNMLTITKFKGGDPEQVDYNGIYMGKSLPNPKSFILGLKMSF